MFWSTVADGRSSHFHRLLGEGLRTGVAEAVRLVLADGAVHLAGGHEGEGRVLLIVPRAGDVDGERWGLGVGEERAGEATHCEVSSAGGL